MQPVKGDYNMSKNNNKIDAYIEEYHKSTGELEYNLFFNYNGIDSSLIYKDKEAKIFAINFKWKYLNSNTKPNNHTYTDDHGWTKEKTELSSILSSIKGIKEIDDAIVALVVASVHPEINSDLTIHLNDKEYDLVRNADRIEYFSPDILKTGNKGFSKNELHEIDKDIRTLKESINIKKAQ